VSVPLLTWSNPTPRSGRPGRVELVEAESAFVSEVKGAEGGERGLVGESAVQEKRPPNQRLHPTALRARKSAASRAFAGKLRRGA